MQQTRIARLRALVSEAGGQAEFVRRHRNPAADKEIDPAHISQILTGHRSFGEKAARSMELRAGLDSGYFDRADGVEIEQAPEGVPVVGTAQLGPDGFWHELEYPVGHGEGLVRYPTKDPNAYALRVKGDSMRPRIKSGEFVVIEPNSALVIGEEVMVQTKDGKSMIKILDFRRNGVVQVSSINEDFGKITFNEAEIAKIHYVSDILKPHRYYERNL